MVHKTKTYESSSYEEIRDSGQFDTPENCLQYLLDMKILPTHRMCTSCDVLMVLGVCPTTKYGDGYCWTCTTCSKTCSVRVGSILESSKVTAREFIDMLGQFSYGKNVSVAAQHANVGENTCRRLYNEIQERIAEDIATRPLIGGPMTVVECDEAKFGKSKYDQGRYVEGSWVESREELTTASWCAAPTVVEERRNSFPSFVSTSDREHSLSQTCGRATQT